MLLNRSGQYGGAKQVMIKTACDSNSSVSSSVRTRHHITLGKAEIATTRLPCGSSCSRSRPRPCTPMMAVAVDWVRGLNCSMPTPSY